MVNANQNNEREAQNSSRDHTSEDPDHEANINRNRKHLQSRFKTTPICFHRSSPLSVLIYSGNFGFHSCGFFWTMSISCSLSLYGHSDTRGILLSKTNTFQPIQKILGNRDGRNQETSCLHCAVKPQQMSFGAHSDSRLARSVQ